MRIKSLFPAALVMATLLFAWRDAVAQPHDEHDSPAASEHESTGHAAEAHDSGGHGSKPGLLDWDVGSAVWSIVVFVILLVVLRLTAWKPILEALNQREQFITTSLENAKKERQEAERLMKEYTAQVHKAREEASAIVEEGRRDAEAVRRRINDEAKQQAQEILNRAQREIRTAQENAVAELYSRSLDLAANLASKIIRRQLTPDDHRALLDQSLAEIGQIRREPHGPTRAS